MLRWLFLFFILINGCCTNVYAQLLDDEEELFDTNEAVNIISVENNESNNNNNGVELDSEELYNEMFNDYSSTVYEDTPGTFDEPAEKIVDALSNVDKLAKQNEQKTKDAKEEELPPLEGDLKIGISKGSFVFFKDILGRTKCSFGVTLKSTLNRDINNISLKLEYPDNNRFAFIFKDIKENSADEHFITTDGDICYFVDGVPHISIHKCKVRREGSDVCAKLITWDNDIRSPDTSKHPYRSLLKPIEP